MEKILLFAAVGGLLAWPVGAKGVSLDGAWELSYRFQQEGGAWKTVPAKVPGDAYVALQAVNRPLS